MKAEGKIIDIRTNRAHTHTFQHQPQNHQQPQLQHMPKNVNHSVNFLNMRKSLHFPMTNGLSQMKFTSHPNNICTVPQTTTNANNPLNTQNGHGAYVLNQLSQLSIVRTNGNPVNPYFPI
jgi:hypothetical protein